MDVRFSKKAEAELDAMDNSLRKRFLKHAEKVGEMPPGKHLKHGLQENVEKVTKQARFVYTFKEETCYILRCFKTHKEYEHWYTSFR